MEQRLVNRIRVHRTVVSGELYAVVELQISPDKGVRNKHNLIFPPFDSNPGENDIESLKARVREELRRNGWDPNIQGL